MGKISKNFNRQEFACQCGCGFDTVDVKLVEILQDVRDHFMKPIKINSGCRCVKHNKAVGGSQGSKHVLAKAADFVVEGVHENEVYSYLDDKYSDTLGLGLYKGRTHVDSREHKARWVG